MEIRVHINVGPEAMSLCLHSSWSPAPLPVGLQTIAIAIASTQDASH
jgi:hypothetical protein